MFFFFLNFFKAKQNKFPQKPRKLTFILEPIISPGVISCPAPLDDPLINHELVRLFTDQELIETVLGTNPPVDITNLESAIFWNDYLEQIDKYFVENPAAFDNFNIDDISTWPTLEALINSGQTPIQVPNIGGALETLPPPLIMPVDPPRYDISGGRINVNLNPPLLTNNIPDINLTAENSSQIIDISELFIPPKGGEIEYKVISYDDEILNVNLQDNQLYIEALPKTGESKVTIQATTETGEIATHTFSVFNNYVAPESLGTINSGLAELQNVINANSGNLLAALDSDEAENYLESLIGIAEQNPELLQLLKNPENLNNLGLDNSSVATLQQLLESQELANEFDLDVPLGEALSQPDSRIFDKFLLNGNDAVSLLPDNAKQPKIGFIDFTQDNHIQQVRNTFASVNPLAKHKSFKVRGGNWASQLVKFVDKLKRAGENHGIANLSFDLSQRDDVGVTTRYELTPAEQQAIQYARDNNVLLVVASGNTGDVMSALGQASQKFDNIISVGAVNQFESKADYSAYGEGLNLMAPGGTWQNDPKAFIGTSRATAYVSGAASLVWAANPELSFQQVKQLLIDTAADLDAPGWDAQTGAGLVNIKEAIYRAPFIEPDKKPGFSEKPGFWQPFSGEGRVRTLARPASPGTEAVINQLQNTQETLLQQWEILTDLGNPLLDLPDLKSELEGKITEALEKYQQVSTDAGITTTQAQQWAEALALATQHYQIEQGRLLALQARQQ
ncbi:MAG: S8 family serine peptidase, partial [Microcoleaceae cyanobacterium MO_207.B10]|nr:S8 family serine peptidase [Microcoleaceae cyanobacterium MO_207.B10]